MHQQTAITRIAQECLGAPLTFLGKQKDQFDIAKAISRGNPRAELLMVFRILFVVSQAARHLMISV